ncbi:putative chitin deacetylase [Colletotrichum sublineola]|uniref:Putative chitin deacetylase n=1 Tax=Colletotrichum sublineola TaxID=1173701 RepID=A0A066XSH9_COLSU|nr:putative chitin deacetylase [Colletotrichum sublineola]
MEVTLRRTPDRRTCFAARSMTDASQPTSTALRPTAASPGSERVSRTAARRLLRMMILWNNPGLDNPSRYWRRLNPHPDWHAIDHCKTPGCFFQFGPACDVNKIRPGLNTSGIARTKLGQVEYGGPGIYSCTIPGDVALTYHDGPASYIDDLLDLLNKYNASATFMIAGNNNAKGEIDNATLPWASTIMRIYTDGHQITSHTWSHADLVGFSALPSKNDMYKPEIALRNILGVIPTYMGSGSPLLQKTTPGRSLAFLKDPLLFLHGVVWLQTDIQKSEDTVDQSIDAKPVPSDSCLVIGHDIHQQTAYSLTEYMLQRFQGRKFVTIGECLGDPKDNWDRADSRTTLG